MQLTKEKLLAVILSATTLIIGLPLIDANETQETWKATQYDVNGDNIIDIEEMIRAENHYIVFDEITVNQFIEVVKLYFDTAPTVGNTQVGSIKEGKNPSASIYGYVKDKDGIPRDGFPVYLENLNTSEQIIDVSHDGGYYSFNLDSLEKGWYDGNRIYILASYLAQDGMYYYRDTYLTITDNQLPYEINLSVNIPGTNVYVKRELPDSVLAGSNLTVKLTGNSLGEASVIWENLPEGFTYNGCSLPVENQDDYFPENHTVRFTLINYSPSFSYYLTAPSSPGKYIFSGYFLEVYKNKHNVSGDNMLTTGFISVSFHNDRVVGETIAFNASVTGGFPPYTYKWDFDSNGVFDASGEKVSHMYEKEGEYTINLVVQDSRGMNFTKTINLTIYPPMNASLDCGDPPYAERNEQKQLSLSVGGGKPPYMYEWDLNNDGVYEKKGETVTSLWENVGFYNISCKIIDSATPPHILTKTFTLQCRDTKFLSPVIKPGNGSAVNDPTHHIRLEYGEDALIQNFSIDGEQVNLRVIDNRTYETFLTIGELPEGEHLVKVKAVDKYANENMFTSSFTFDMSKPTLTITSPVVSTEVSNQITVTADAFDKQTSIQRVDFELIKNGTIVSSYSVYDAPYIWKFDVSKLDSGVYVVKATAYDSAGNVDTASVDIVVKHELPYLLITGLGAVFAVVSAVVFLFYRKKKRM